MSGCTGCRKKKTNWQVTLGKDDKIPYGSYIAFKSLPSYFPKSHIEPFSKGFRYQNMNEAVKDDADSAALLVLTGLDFYLSQEELDQLISFATKGNEIMLFCSRMDSKMEHIFKCEKDGTGYEDVPLSVYDPSNENIHALKLAADTSKSYGMTGRTLLGFFHPTKPEIKDTSNDPFVKENNRKAEQSSNSKINYDYEILGTTKKRVDFIRYQIGKGHISLHAAPLVLSNYFLLQKNNRKYLDGIWQTLPANISHIYWNDYYKRRQESASKWMLLKYPATRWAIIIAILTLLSYVLFETKRRQRVIPVVKPPENASVSFIETVGRLYYNKADHTNLAEKMIQHFLEWVRSYYFLNTNKMDETFCRQLSVKSGLPETKVTELVEHIQNIRDKKTTVDEAQLYKLHQSIQQFEKMHA
jgi:hypothetical protein